MNISDQTSASLPIAAVERDTGLSKDTLRVWERRYGFPEPERDENGERLYPAAQVNRLRLIKRLLDRGRRPAKLMQCSDADLGEMLESLREDEDLPRQSALLASAMPLIRRRAGLELRAQLNQQLLKNGLQRFAREIVAPLNAAIGEAWLSGEIDVAEEHLYTEQVQNVLRSAIGMYTAQGSAPRVLLTTFPDELHVLGLLMAEATLVPEGATCVSLGAQTPLQDIHSIVLGGRFEVVALSFSAAFPVRQAISGLNELRKVLPPEVEIWCGGSALIGKQKRLPGIVVIEDLEACLAALRNWRENH